MAKPFHQPVHTGVLGTLGRAQQRPLGCAGDRVGHGHRAADQLALGSIGQYEGVAGEGDA